MTDLDPTKTRRENRVIVEATTANGRFTFVRTYGEMGWRGNQRVIGWHYRIRNNATGEIYPQTYGTLARCGRDTADPERFLRYQARYAAA